ncbi:MAG: hypothetical protein ABW120_10770 [Sedimenticola sp.]
MSDNKEIRGQDRSQEPVEGSAVDQSRRGFTKAGLAAPVIMSLTSRPVLGQCVSVSGFMSGNASHPHECIGYGCTPGYWKQNPAAWTCAGYVPGACMKWDKNGNCTGFTSVPGTATEFADVFMRPHPSGYLTLMEVLHRSNGNDIYFHAIAAVLNSRCFEYGTTENDIVNAVNTVVDSGDSVKIEALKNILDDNNNRGCPYNARYTDCGEGDFVKLPEGCSLPTEYDPDPENPCECVPIEFIDTISDS